MLHYLRIAVSATCLIVSVLLISIWVRSYWWHDQISSGETPAGWQIDSVPGHFQIERMLSSTYPYWEFNSYPVRTADSTDTPLLPDITLSSYPDYLDVGSPYWFALLFAAVVGILAAWPWLRWRFSVRMLFIAMTLMAAPLGALTYVLRYVFVTHSY
jgi:hypothetical protein